MQPATRVALAVALTAALPLAVPSAASSQGPARASAACPNTTVVPIDARTRDRAARALRCLINEQRSAQGAPRLQLSSALSGLARTHSTEMQRFDFLRHTDRRGRDLRERLLASSWPRAGKTFTASETVSWGRADGRTPAALLKTLTANAGNRSRLLRGTYRDLGVGLATGIPVKGARGNGVTLTLILGRR